MNHIGTQTIETERLLLRRFREEDAQAMFDNWASDDEVTRFLTWPTYRNVDSAKQYMAYVVNNYMNNHCYDWMIELKSFGQPIGSIGVVDMDERVGYVEVGYCIGRNWWHQGIMTEAFGAVIAFLFEQVGVNRVEARHDTRNPHSGDVMRKCGLQYEGTLRQRGLNNQGINDVAYYGILREEYLAGKDEAEQDAVTWDALQQSGDLLWAAKRYVIEKMKKIYPYWFINQDVVFLLPDGLYMSVFSMRGKGFYCLGMEYGEKAELRPDDGDLYAISNYETPDKLLADMLAENQR